MHGAALFRLLYDFGRDCQILRVQAYHFGPFAGLVHHHVENHHHDQDNDDLKGKEHHLSLLPCRTL